MRSNVPLDETYLNGYKKYRENNILLRNSTVREHVSTELK